MYTLLDLRIKEQKPKKLTVTIERKEKRKEKREIKYNKTKWNSNN